MTDPRSASRPVAETFPGQCESCGRTVTLGSKLCPDCERNFATQRDPTSDDHTPYAQAREEGRRGWARMCWWVVTAGSQRLTHLGLLRPSPAARRFARINIFLLACGTALAVMTNTGWHPGTSGQPTKPSGHGWVRIASRDLRPPPDIAYRVPTSLWWNVPLAMIGGAGAFVLTAVTGGIVLRRMARGGERSLRGPYEGTSAMRTAVAYSTAYVPLLALAGLIFGLRPLTEVAAVREWALAPPRHIVPASAAVLLTIGLLLGWFWLIRLGVAAPLETRRAARNYFLVWPPLTVLCGAAVVTAALYFGLPWVAQRLQLTW
jgi:hypothetical protein